MEGGDLPHTHPFSTNKTQSFLLLLCSASGGGVPFPLSHTRGGISYSLSHFYRRSKKKRKTKKSFSLSPGVMAGWTFREETEPSFCPCITHTQASERVVAFPFPLKRKKTFSTTKLDLFSSPPFLREFAVSDLLFPFRPSKEHFRVQGSDLRD